MLGKTLKFLVRRLNDFLGADTTTPSKVEFLDLSKDPPSFSMGNITLGVVNIEEERQLRPPDPYFQRSNNEQVEQITPPLRLMIHLLFASRKNSYDQALDELGSVLLFFQQHKLFQRKDFTDLPAGVDQLSMELLPMTYTNQNEIWGALKTAYLPCVFYRLKVVILRGEFSEPTELIENVKVKWKSDTK